MPTSIRTALAGRYVLERELGHGATAGVYAARDLKHGRRVALKVIEHDVVSTLGTARFLQEIRTTARLHHPHILPLFDSGDADGFIYYSMPLVEGESLRQRLERLGRMPLHVAVPLITEVANALSYAHSVGIVHRDVKPENIMIDGQEHAWVADFGLARALASAVDQRLTGTAMAVGSPHYMSPEQAAGEADVDGRSDIYSLGCIAFELLCGEPPFTAGTVPALLARHVSEPAPSVRDRNSDLSKEVDAALKRAMAKDRSHRFRDARDFAAVLNGGREVSADVAQASRSARPSVAGRSNRSLPAPLNRSKRNAVVVGIVAYIALVAVSLQVVDAVSRNGRLGIILAVAGIPVAALLAWMRAEAKSGEDLRHSTEPTRVGPDPAAHEHPPPPPPAPVHTVALPTAATAFIGRAEEVRELTGLLCASRARLVTVTGTGGVGKTRLALYVAEQVAPTFRDGVAYAALSGLASADLLVPSLAESLGIQLSRREDPLVELKAFLREKELLIVLDNFEHLTSAAGLLVGLVDEAPGVQLLVTSRERLNLRHETLVSLDGLTLAGEGDDSDAVKLFVAGACRLDRHFELDGGNRELVSRICALLGGIPLAIELASAWVRALSCSEILAEIQRDLDVLSSDGSDLEKRHRSLRATFDASWRLLSADEQSAIARLAVFRSAFDRAAAGQVGEASVPLLRSLVDKSLLTRAGDRLLMLDVVRTFALDRLAADPEMQRRACDRHLACFCNLLHTLESRVQRADAAAIRQVADSIDDIRAAWQYATQTNNSTALLRAMDGLFQFYDARGWAREGAEVFAQSRAAIGDVSLARDVSRQTRLAAVRLDVRRGVFLHRLGDLREAESVLRASVAAARDLEGPADIAFAVHRLGAVRHGMGDYAEAERLHREGWTLAQQLGDRLVIGWSMMYLGNVAWSRGEFDPATRLYTDALELLREERDLNGMWVTLNNLGVLAASRQQYAEAQRRFREGLALESELKNPRFRAQGLHNLGCAARELGDASNAQHWLEEALEISNRMGYQSMAGLSLVTLAEVAIGEGDEAGGVATLHMALRTAGVARNDPLALEALLILAQLRLSQGDTQGAAELAAIIARHPGSNRDAQRKIAELFAQIGTDPPPASENAIDLGAVIDQIAGSHPRHQTAASGVGRRQRHINVQAAGDS